jgi:hypothetical protein
LLSFYAAAGFKTHRSEHGGWYEAGPRFLLAVPTHLPLSIDAAEARTIFRSTGALGIRYVAAHPDLGRPSWQMSATGTAYSMDDFSGNTRSKIRRGLKANEVRRISGSELAGCGEQAFLDTVERQARADRYGIDRWHRLLAAADRTPGIEIWAAWHEGTLAAYLLTMVFDDVCELYEARSRNDCLRHYPNNALIYTITEEMLVRRGKREVTFGIEGLEELDTLDQFKLAMGFVRKPIRQHVIFRPPLGAALAWKPVRDLLGRVAARPGSASFWRRAQSLVGFAGYGA